MRDRKEYMKAYYQAHKEDRKEYMKAYRQAHKEECKARAKEFYQVNKESFKAKKKAYNQAHKEELKAYYQSHKEERKEYMKAYKQSDVNSLGKTKESIRKKSLYYLNKYGTKIPGYHIHHCCTYTEPYKFIYCRKEMHHLIHAYLKQHNIDADSDHYKYIKHLLDDTVFKYNIDD